MTIPIYLKVYMYNKKECIIIYFIKVANSILKSFFLDNNSFLY